MSKSKQIPPGGQVVTEARLAVLLSRFARAADASMTVQLNAMEERLRDEFAASRVLDELGEPEPYHDVNPAEDWQPTDGQ